MIRLPAFGIIANKLLVNGAGFVQLIGRFQAASLRESLDEAAFLTILFVFLALFVRYGSGVTYLRNLRAPMFDRRRWLDFG